MYDAIVIGSGGVGASALLHLADRGARVLGVDRFHPPHDRGSSHGQTRLIRKAYFEHPDYVPLVLRSYSLWNEWEKESGRRLLRQTGLVEAGPADGVVIPGVRESGRRHGLAFDEWTTSETMRHFPGLLLPPEFDVVFEPDAGYLEVESCVETCLELAVRRGATFIANQPVLDWQADGAGFRVTTSNATFLADSLIIAGGSWSAGLLADLAIPLVVLRKTLHWFDVEPGAYLADDGFPAFLAECPNGIFYGFPVVDDLGLKAAEHTGGQPVSHPDELDRRQHPSDSLALTEFLRRCLPAITDKQRCFSVCMYTMTPDGHFLVDRHPAYPRVAFAAGLSGHGFKFVPVLGEILADLVLHGETRHSIDFLALGRLTTT